MTKTTPSANPLANLFRDPLWQRLAKRKSALVGLAVVLLMVFVAIFAPLLAPYDPTAQSWTAVRKAPSAAHWFGTDEAGRDILSRIIWGARASLMAGLTSVGIAMAIGVPLGIWAAHKPRVWQSLQPVMDLMQTMPTFVYLIPILILFGLGAAPALIVTIIFAMPAPVRMTYLGITSIPKPMIEAGESFGATKRQLLWKVELPAALPTIMAGLTQCIMLSLSMVVIATLIGAPSLGNPVNRALNNRNIPLGIEAGLAIVVLAIILDRVLAVKSGGRK